MQTIANVQIDDYTAKIMITEPEKQLEYPTFFQEHYRFENFDNRPNSGVEITKLEYPETDVGIVTCYHCDLTVVKESALEAEFYDSPFDEHGETVYFCSYLCEDSMHGHIYSGDFMYFECPVCDRTICEQSPRNGWHSQYVIDDDEVICNACYEARCFENGVDLETFENGEVKGLFFIDSELQEHGFDIVPGFDSYYIGNEEPYIKKAIELINAGHRVINMYDRLAIGGLEGYVTMYVK